MESSVASLGNNGEEVKPYKIHVSSKYLDLTKKKLELTRLPHELLVPRAREWEYGTPKGEVEPLIDFWLEQYSWRTRESQLSSAFPQYRTALSISSNPHPLRIHFIHLRSPHQNAFPLLLIPSFPLPNLSPLITPLFSSLMDPVNGEQPFHIVVPSIPGLGFSDAWTSEEQLLEGTVKLCDALMRRLGYEFYIASATGSGRNSPAGIDYYLLRLLNVCGQSCLGVHVIEPVALQPRAGSWEWLKFSIAKFFHANLWGYASLDFQALKHSADRDTKLNTVTAREGRESEITSSHKGPAASYSVVGVLGLREPHTFAYALCDSPVGLLSLVCSALRQFSPNHTLTRQEIVDVTQMAWLPGPEAGMRFWSTACKEVQRFEAINASTRKEPNRVAVTVFTGGEGYVCPAWVGEGAELVFAQRVQGRPGLVARERTEVVLEGIRGLTKVLQRIDGRMKISALHEVVIGDSEGIGGAEILAEEGEEGEEDGMQLEVESPGTVVALNYSR